MKNKIKYEAEVNEMLRIAFYQEGMKDEEYQKIIQEALKDGNKTIEELSDDIEIGIKNGISIEQQIEILNAMMNTEKVIEKP